MKKPLITGAWKKLIFINYNVSEKVLKPFLPKGTELNLHENNCYVTLAGFVFSGIRLWNIPVPFHQVVPEVNLRFYVKPKGSQQQERGVVFLREIVSQPLLGVAANFLYKEHYSIWPVSKKWRPKEVIYRWYQPTKQKIGVQWKGKACVPEKGSHEEFIMMQYYGYTKASGRKTLRYQVQHPVWNFYPVSHFRMHVDFRRCFGKCFKFLSKETPASVFLAEGSPVEIYRPEIFTG